MRYYEIIKESSSESFKVAILDLLTPIAASGVEYVTFKQLAQKLKSIPSGLHIDRALIMQILDPNEFPLIKSIEGDKIFLNPSIEGPERAVNDEQKDREADQIKKTAASQALKSIKK